MTYFGIPGLRFSERYSFRQRTRKEKKLSLAQKVERWKVAVELATEFKFDDVISNSRKRDYANIRAIISFHLYVPKHVTYESIAKVLGNRDHTSIIHYVKKKYPDLKQTWYEFKELEERLLHYL